MLRHVHEPFSNIPRTDFRFKNIKLHNILEHISNSSVLSNADKQYVTRVIQNEIKSDPKYIFQCGVCHEYMNTQNPIIHCVRVHYIKGAKKSNPYVMVS